MWVLSVCINGVWHKENWRYQTENVAMEWALQYQDQYEADATIVEQVADRAPYGGHAIDNTEDGYLKEWLKPDDPWNFKQCDFFKGVRVRERHRKKHRHE